MELTADVRREIAELSQRYGEPRAIDALIHDGFDDPIRRRDRYGEVLMAVRRPNGTSPVAIRPSNRVAVPVALAAPPWRTDHRRGIRETHAEKVRTECGDSSRDSYRAFTTTEPAYSIPLRSSGRGGRNARRADKSERSEDGARCR